MDFLELARIPRSCRRTFERPYTEFGMAAFKHLYSIRTLKVLIRLRIPDFGMVSGVRLHYNKIILIISKIYK